MNGKVGAIRQMPAESAMTQVGAIETTSAASPAIASMRSQAAVSQKMIGPSTPQPAAPAKAATHTEDAVQKTMTQGRSFPANTAEPDPCVSFMNLRMPPARHSRESIEMKARSAPSAKTPGIKVGSRYATKLNAGLPKKKTSGVVMRR